MGKPKAPKPPDPIATAAGQTSTNVATAVAEAQLNNQNQITPEGTLTFDQTDTFQFFDPVTKVTYDIPRFTATQALSPEQQLIFDQTQQAELGLASIANQQAGRLENLLGTNVQLGNEEVEGRLFELGSARLDPLFEEREDALRTRLINQGIRPGSEAFEREFRLFQEGRNDAFNNLLLRGRGQAVQEQLAERNQPINEITALLSASQVQQPNFIGAPQRDIPTTDFAGIVQRDFENRLAAQQFKAQNQAGLLGTVGGLFGTLLSDEREKENVEKVGEVEGHNLYKFNYKGEDEEAPRHIGLMAQEVEKKDPDAVHEVETLFGPRKVVDYDKALGDAAPAETV